MSDDSSRYLDGTPDPNQTEDWETIEDADDDQDPRVLGDVEGFKDTGGLDADDLRHRAELAGAALLHYAVTGLLVAGTLSVGVWAWLAPPPLGQPPAASASPSIVERARVHQARDRLEWALETHRLEANDYPRRLAALTNRGLLRSRDLYYPLEGSRWNYRKTADGFRLEAEQAASN